MTVTADIARWYYTGNGVLDTYPFTAEIYAATDLKVYVSDVLQVLNVDYTIAVTSIGVPAGGNIVFVAASIPALSAPISIILDLPLTQLVDYIEGDKFPAEVHERALDRLVKIAQALKESSNRVAKLSESSTYSGLSMPDPVASQYLAWKDDLSGLKNVDVVLPSGALVITDYMKTLVNDADAAEAQTTLGISAFIKTLLNDADAATARNTLEAMKIDGSNLAIGADANGDMYYRAAAVLARLAIGTAGQILEVNAGATAPAWVSKGVVQVVSTQTGAVATGATTIPYDDTIPQKNEGDEYMTLAITPASATNKLIIDVIWQGCGNVEEKIIVALFQDDTAGALAAAAARNVAANVPVSPIIIRHYMVAGTTSATTFKVRAGLGSAGTITFNGASAGRIFGGVMASSITITELRA